ncbi:MAG TPA: hypothetical protein VGX96_08340 [Candidatus Elarobacter sp.]|nr:hypothetical protein [Candidatus Elarobacter sp.]
MLTYRARTALAVAVSIAVLPARAIAGSGDAAITAIVNTTPAAAAGGTVTFQVGLTAPAAAWTPGSYHLAAELHGENDALVASSKPVSGAPVERGRTTMLFVDLALPQDGTGTYRAVLVVDHDGAVVERSEPQPVVVGGLAPSQSSAAAPAHLGGNLATNANFASSDSRSALLTLTGKYGANQSFTTTGALSTTPGGSRPVIGIQTATTLTQLGTFAPSLDPLALDGVTGSGVGFRKSWGAVRAVQLAYVSGGHATANPYSIEALSYALPAAGGKLTFTMGLAQVDGPAQGIVADLNSGSFAAISFARAPSERLPFGYTLRYSAIRYDDKTGEQRFDRALEAGVAFKTGRVGWTLDMLRAGPYYPTITAPGISSDRQTERIAATIPLRSDVSATVAMNGYRDALPGSASLQTTHFWTESLTLTKSLRNGDSLSVNLVGATQHQAGATDLASASDTSNITYNARRGPYSFQLTLGGNNQRDNTGNLQHTSQDGITVARTLIAGLSLSAGVNFTKNVASDPSGTSSLTASNVTLGWTRGPLTLSSSIVNSRSRPFLGLAPADTTGESIGISLKMHKTTALQATLTNNRSAATTTTGALNVTRQF